MKKILPLLFIFLLVNVFFWQFLFKNLLPVPLDVMIGLYNPFRDFYAKDYPNGIPFKNFLITDPVRQLYPWKEMVISLEKRANLPLWNPYNSAGTPLLANFQSGAFYFFNILFWVFSFSTSWSLIVFLTPLLSGIFMYWYLNNLKLNKWAGLLGAIVFSFCGFSISWLEWGNIGHVGLWLPLILLSIDKIFLSKKNTKWFIVYLFSIVSAFFAGHLQIFFYLLIFTLAYFLARWLQFGKKINVFVKFLVSNIVFLIISLIQLMPTLQFLNLSARDVDVLGMKSEGWFISWQHLIQFIAPDFFGNPTTLNYWGIWNYGEMIGYIGIIPLIFSLFAIFYRKDKKTLFFSLICFLSLIFALPNFISKIPFLLHIPLLQTSQPTRLLFLIDFSLAVLSALGLDYYFKNKKKIIVPILFLLVTIVSLWVFVILNQNSSINFVVAKNNLKFPSLIILLSTICLAINLFLSRISIKIKNIVNLLIISVVVFDLFRFGWKFTPFTSVNYLYPETKAISFLQKQNDQFRIMSTDAQILPPNFSCVYKIEAVDVYDPIYLRRYGELIAAMERSEANIEPPFGFNRIITPHNFESKIADLLGVKYILSLSPIESSKLVKVFQEGKTIIYENKKRLPRSFFVENVKYADSKNMAIKFMFDDQTDLSKIAIVEDNNFNFESKLTIGEAKIDKYSENKIIINTKNEGSGFLILTDSFYPTWRAKIDGKSTKIYLVDYNFRGIFVPSGNHSIEFNNNLF